MKLKLSLLIKVTFLMCASVLLGSMSCSHQKNIAKTKVSEAPEHDAPDQAEIDSIKASYNKRKH